MTTTDRRDATDAQFADELARLNRLDVADESAVERVARAICAAGNSINPSADPDLIWGTLETHGLADHYRRLARAAIDALKPAPGTDTSGHDEESDDQLRHCIHCGALCDHRVQACECGPDCPLPKVAR